MEGQGTLCGVVVEVERVGLVEAMASHRPYRPPCGLQAALKEISQNRELLYAPEVVDACVKLFTEKGFTLESDRGQGG